MTLPYFVTLIFLYYFWSRTLNLVLYRTRGDTTWGGIWPTSDLAVYTVSGHFIFKGVCMHDLFRKSSQIFWVEIIISSMKGSWKWFELFYFKHVNVWDTLNLINYIALRIFPSTVGNRTYIYLWVLGKLIWFIFFLCHILGIYMMSVLACRSTFRGDVAPTF